MPLPYIAQLASLTLVHKRHAFSQNRWTNLLFEPVGHLQTLHSSGVRAGAVYYLSLQLGLTLEHPPDPIPVLACVIARSVGCGTADRS